MSSCLRFVGFICYLLFLSNSIWVGKVHTRARTHPPTSPNVNCRNIPSLYFPTWKALILEKYIANTFKVNHVDYSKRASV